MLIVSTIRLMLDLSVSCVLRPCLYMLGSSSQPKCFACVNLAYTRCMWTLESITPDHHVVLRNNKLLQRCIVRGNTFLKFNEGSFICYRRSKQIRCINMINNTCNQKVTWYGQYHFAPFDLHLRGAMIIVVTGMTPWSPSSWSRSLCLHEVVTPTITSTSMANALSNKVK